MHTFSPLCFVFPSSCCWEMFQILEVLLRCHLWFFLLNCYAVYIVGFSDGKKFFVSSLYKKSSTSDEIDKSVQPSSTNQVDHMSVLILFMSVIVIILHKKVLLYPVFICLIPKSFFHTFCLHTFLISFVSKTIISSVKNSILMSSLNRSSHLLGTLQHEIWLIYT